MVVEVRRNNLNGPTFQQSVALFKHVHGQCVGFFPRGTSRTPDAQPPGELPGFVSDYFGKDYFPQRVELGLAAEQAGLSNRDLVQQVPNLPVASRVRHKMIPIVAWSVRARLFHSPS